MNNKILRKISKTLIKNGITYSTLNSPYGLAVSPELKEKLKCSTCKGEGKFKASTDLPKCRTCDGSGINLFRHKPKNHIDKVIENLISMESAKKLQKLTIKQLEDKIQKIIGGKIK